MSDRENTELMSDETKIPAETDHEKLAEAMSDIENESIMDDASLKNFMADQKPAEEIMDKEENLKSMDNNKNPEQVMSDNEIVNNVSVDDDNEGLTAASKQVENVANLLSDDDEILNIQPHTVKAVDPTPNGNVTPDIIADDPNVNIINVADDTDNLVIDSNEVTNAVSDEENLLIKH
jgi:hypothetical protein